MPIHALFLVLDALSGVTPAVERLVRDDTAHLADPIAQIQRIELGLVERLAPVLGPGQLEAGVEDRGQWVKRRGAHEGLLDSGTMPHRDSWAPGMSRVDDPYSTCAGLIETLES